MRSWGFLFSALDEDSDQVQEAEAIGRSLYHIIVDQESTTELKLRSLEAFIAIIETFYEYFTI